MIYSFRAEFWVEVQAFLNVADVTLTNAYQFERGSSVYMEWESSADLSTLQPTSELADDLHVVRETMRACTPQENDLPFRWDYLDG